MPDLIETIRARMASLNDESLLKIVTEDAGQYSTDALKTANEEILARGIDIDEVLKQIEAQKEAQIENNAYEADEDSDEYPDIMPDSQNPADSNVFLMAKEYYKSRSPVEIPQVRPWIRLLARGLDVLLVNTILFAIFKCFHTESNMQLLGISVILPVTTLFDGLFLRWWGATPGKWILKMKVTDKDGGRLSYAKAYKRSLMVLLFGEALGIQAILSSFTWVVAYFRLKYLGKTYWDYKNQTTVVHGKIGITRAMLYVFVMLALPVCFYGVYTI